MKKYLILIDIWENLTDPIEIEIKENIIKFIDLIDNKPDWHIYWYVGSTEVDRKIKKRLDSFKNSTETNNPLLIYNTNENSTTFYYGGFHTQYCVFFNTIGIEKLLQISKLENRDWFILEELTASIIPTSNKDIVKKLKDLYFYNSGNSDLLQDEIIIQNYRTELIKLKTVSINNIVSVR